MKIHSVVCIVMSFDDMLVVIMTLIAKVVVVAVIVVDRMLMMMRWRAAGQRVNVFKVIHDGCRDRRDHEQKDKKHWGNGM